MPRRVALSSLGLVVAIALAGLVGAIILLATHQNPVDAVNGLWAGAFGSDVET